MALLVDETGNRYGRLVVLRRAENSRTGIAKWLCRCDCGKEKAILGTSLRNGATSSCGCLRVERLTKDMTGKTFGRLTALEYYGSNGKGNALWRCRCECGQEVVTVGGSLRSGKTLSCGCSRRKLPCGEGSFRQLFGRMKRGAKERGYIWELSLEQVREITKQPCYYCGVEPSQLAHTPSCNGDYIYNGLDRMGPESGYTISNVVACCGPCNFAKRGMTVGEFLDWIKGVYKYSVRGRV